MQTRILALLLAGALALGLTACGSGGTSAEDQGEDQAAGIAAGELKVGLILTGEGGDGSAQGHIQGLQDACQALGLDYDAQAVVKTVTEADSAWTGAIEELADAGCQVIFAGSTGHEQAMTTAAGAHPDIQFCQADGAQEAADSLDNTHSYAVKLYEARYLAGIAAGLNTETNRLGYVATEASAQVISDFTAFYLGAKRVNPQVTMLVSFAGRTPDPAQEADTAQAFIDQGCDVISQHTASGAAAITAQRNGVFAVGCGEDMAATVPKAALVSAQVNWEAYYTYALECLLTGQDMAQSWWGGYGENACGLSPLNEAIAVPSTQQAIEEAAQGLSDGTLQVFAGPLHGVDGKGKELTLAEGEVYEEEAGASSSTFSFVVDGITVLS